MAMPSDNEMPMLQLEITKDEDNYLRLDNEKEKPMSISSRRVLARQVGESERQIQRYIRLTYLIPQILRMVDDGKIAFIVAVDKM